MTKRLLAFLVFFHLSFVYAQTIKTDVLVIGGSPAGVAAAIQSARSKVKTILVEPSTQLCPTLQDATAVKLEADKNLPSGIWGEFRKRVREYYQKTPGYDTTYNAPLQFEQETGAAILTNIADTVKNLAIELNIVFMSIKKDDDRWDVVVSENGKTETIKARIVIDATDTGIVIKSAGAKYMAYDNMMIVQYESYYRTSIAAGNMPIPSGTRESDGISYNYPQYPSYCVSIKGVIANSATNLLIAQPYYNLKYNIDYLPSELMLGQGTGAIAAYCAFFKTTTNNLRVRAIQTELLDFKGYLLPFEDIGTDPHWRDIQQVCATGMLKGVQKNISGKTEFIFDCDSTVNTAEIKPVMLEIYTRAFLWFNKEKPGKDFTVGNLLSFISEITLNDPDNLQKIIAHDWNAKYKFTSTFDIDRPITRREFTILTNKYLNPFARTVDLDGKVVN